MARTNDICPSPNSLKSFGLETSPEAEASLIELHLSRCESCVTGLRGYTDADDFVNQIRRAATHWNDTDSETDTRITKRIQGLLDTHTRSSVQETLIDPKHLQHESVRRTSSLIADSSDLFCMGKYRVLRLIGSGGMGEVYEAEDTELGRRVALKAIRASMQVGDGIARRFKREAEVIASLRHRGIVTIYDFGVENDVPYMAMELLEGLTLEQTIQTKQRLSIIDVLDIGSQFFKALHAAHQKGVIHRDLKPSNIWLESSPDGETHVKILDFGLAVPIESPEMLTQLGTVLGTPSYMSPEQASAQKTDARSDLFSGGCVLYCMLTGRSPHCGDNVLAILRSIALDTPPDIQVFRPDAPLALNQLVRDLLAKSPDQRPCSADEVATLLSSVRESMLAERHALNVTKMTQSGLGSRRIRSISIAAGSAAFLFLVATIIILIRNKDGNRTTIKIESDSIASVTIESGDGTEVAMRKKDVSKHVPSLTHRTHKGIVNQLRLID